VLSLIKTFKHIKNHIKRYVLGDIVISKNIDVIMTLIPMYRNEKYWPNPLKFDPDRFFLTNIKDHSY